MNKYKLLISLAAGLLSVLTLVACGNDEADESGSSTDTESKTQGEVEVVTAAPRYDYIEEDVAPNVSITREDYVGITLKVPDSLKIEDEDVQTYITSICFENRTAENGSTQVKNKPLKLGDDAFIYYKGFMDGKEFDGGSNWDDETPYQLGIGSGAFIPGFEDALIGTVPENATKEAPVEIQVTFPEDYGNELAGKDATFKVAIMYSIEYRLPTYDRAFVENTLKYEAKKDFYASDRALLDEFEEFVRDTLIEKVATDLENAKLDALWTHLVDNVECKNLPQMEIDYYIKSYKEDVEYAYDYYTSMNNKEFNELYPDVGSFAMVYFGLDKDEDWEKGLEKLAERMVKKDMISHAIGELEDMEAVTDEEFQAELDYWVQAYSGYMTENEILQSMGAIILRRAAFEQKLTPWLMEQITFTYEDGTPVDTGSDSEPVETESEAASDTESLSESAS